MTKKYLWKYLSLDKFEWLLNNSALYLPSLKKLQVSMDPIEGTTSKRLVKSAIYHFQTIMGNISLSNLNWKHRCLIENIKIAEEKYGNFANTLIETKLNYSYIYSMSYSNKENYSLWKIYPTDLSGTIQANQGIALKMDKKHFCSLFQNKNITIENNLLELGISKPLLENVIYKTKEEIQNIINNKEKIPHSDFYTILKEVLLIKDICYKFAEEKRYIVNLEYDADTINNCKYDEDKSYIHVKFDTLKFFNPKYLNIIISPFANKSFIGYIKYMLIQQNIKDVDKLVLESEIAVPD